MSYEVNTDGLTVCLPSFPVPDRQPKNDATDIAKLVIYCAALIVMGALAAYGVLPRTRPILPGELMVAD